MAIGDAEIRDNGMFNRGVSLGNMLAGLCAATFPILGMLMLTMVQNASDKATMNERVEQYHRQEVGETDRIKKDAEAQAARTEAMREQMTVFHIQQMEKQTETNTSVQNLYNILKTDAPRKGR